MYNDDSPERNLLVVDDNEEIVRTFVRIFEDYCRVFVSADAEQGLSVLKRNSIQVVISDQRMPGLSGTDFLARVRNEYPDTILMLMTGHADIDAIMKAVNECSIFRYITKPWIISELVFIVKSAFEHYDLIISNRRLQKELEEANEELEQRIEQRTAELEQKNRQLEKEVGERRKTEEELARHRDHLEELVRTRTAELEAQNSRLADEIARRGEAEVELRNAKEYAENLIDTANAMAVVIDTEGRIQLFNRAAEVITGYSCEEVVGKSWFETIVPREHYPEVWEVFSQARAGNMSRHYENPILTKDGRERHIIWQNSELLEQGSPRGVISFGIDITERRLVEERLRHSEQTLRTLLDANSESTFLIDIDGTVLAANEMTSRRLGIRPDELVGRNIGDVLTPDVADLRKEKAQEAIRTRSPVHFEDSRHESFFEHTIWPVIDETGEVISLAVLAIDRTEQKKTVEKLKQVSESWNTAFNAISEAIALLDEDGTIQQCNEAMSRMLRMPREDIQGRKCHYLLHASGSSFHICPFRTMLATGKRESDDVFIGGKWYKITADPIYSSSGDIAGAVHIISDITSRKVMENELGKYHELLEDLVRERTAELEAANERLKELDRLKSEFIATMSHELRTPLSSIIGFTGILRQGLAGPLNDEQKKQLGMAYNNARHLMELINDLLDISRIEAGRVELDCSPFNFVDVVNEVKDSLTLQASQKGIRIRTDMPGPIIEMNGDRTRCFQVLLNLANNAVKFTEEGEVLMVAKISDEVLQVNVKDTGIGIRPENLSMLFEPYRQFDVSKRGMIEGTGLGLHLCRKILALMGGTIGVESEFGRGSTFTFTVPLAISGGEQERGGA